MTQVKNYISQILTDLHKHKRVDFRLNVSPYAVNSSERCVEIPWALSNYGGERRILDVGVSLADTTYFFALLELCQIGVTEFHGIDIVPLQRTLHRFKGFEQQVLSHLIFRQTDVRSTGYPDDYFDLIFLISTIEHVGFDETTDAPDTVFNRPLIKPTFRPDLSAHQADFETVVELARILKPGGVLLISVPFGSGGIFMTQDSMGRYAFFVQYNLERWRRLLAKSGLHLEHERFFGHYLPDGWTEVPSPHQLRRMPYLESENMDQGVACARLVKHLAEEKARL